MVPEPMRSSRVPILCGLVCLIATSHAGADDPTIRLRVEAGRFDRRDTPVHIELSAEQVPAGLLEQLRGELPPAWRLRIEGDGDRSIKPIPVQVVGHPGRIGLTWVLSEPMAAGSRRTFRLEPTATPDPRPWTLAERSDGTLEL